MVEEPETSVASVSLDAATVGEGEAATVTAQLDNAGDAAGSHEVELTVDGEGVATKTVIVPADGTAVSFAWTAPGTGEYEIGVDGTGAGTLIIGTVATETSAPTATAVGPDGSGDTPAPADSPVEAADTDDGTTGSDGPGFGVLVALVALLGGLLLGRRQQE
ncbi:hypothetical protein BRC64_08430 [Halobacteriales archaeon QH_10_67_22]|nr:MAG: hypothetical protein BRC64_08430 [Halobacteriales archaeon QH_10_67_22]